jgi:class 3 adenylate cyclase
MKARLKMIVMLLFLLIPGLNVAQMTPGRRMMEDQTGSSPMSSPLTPTPFYRERTFLVLIGFGVGGVGLIFYRIARAHGFRKQRPASFVNEAVLVVDLVGSTHLATHYGESLAVRAANVLNERTMSLAEARGRTFAKNTGDGWFMTFPSVIAACQTAVALLRDLRDQPPDLSPLAALQVRAGISYGEIRWDRLGERHGAAVNKAFRLEGLSGDSFTQVEGENTADENTERNRIYVDEEAAQELQKSAAAEVALRFVGFARLKGFSGLHGVYDVFWESV